MTASKEVFIMAKTIFEQMGGTYTMQVIIACLILPSRPKKNVPSAFGDTAACDT